MKSRFIRERGRLMSDVVYVCDRNNIGGYLFTTGIEKTFDSLDHKFILAVLKYLVLTKTLSPGLKHY